MDFLRPRNNHATQGNGDVFVQSNGPIDPAGRQIDLSDRPLLCSSSNMRNEVVVGGSDHALYSIDVLDARKRHITMYTKTCGHTDWVTSVSHLSDGQVLSAAMDGKLCLWSNQVRNQCIDLSRESIHPISKVLSDVRYNTALSCGYDGNIELWNLSDASVSTAVSSSSSNRVIARGGPAANRNTSMRLSPSAVMTGHTEPVLEASYYRDSLATGDKGGALMIWDLNRGQALTRFRAHPGPITAVECNNSSNVIVTGGTDGYVKVWDPRASGSGLVQKVHVHVREESPRPNVRAPPSSTGRTAGRGTTSSGRSTGRSSIPSSAGRAGGPPSGPISYPVGVMVATYSRGSTNDMSYIITGGGAADDSRLCVLDTRYDFRPVAIWDHHRNGVYSICVVGDNAIFTGDGMGTLLCHELLESEFQYPRNCLKFGLGASEKGAIRSIQCIQNKIITCGEDGNVLIFDF